MNIADKTFTQWQLYFRNTALTLAIHIYPDLFDVYHSDQPGRFNCGITIFYLNFSIDFIEDVEAFTKIFADYVSNNEAEKIVPKSYKELEEMRLQRKEYATDRPGPETVVARLPYRIMRLNGWILQHNEHCISGTDDFLIHCNNGHEIDKKYLEEPNQRELIDEIISQPNRPPLMGYAGISIAYIGQCYVILTIHWD